MDTGDDTTVTALPALPDPVLEPLTAMLVAVYSRVDWKKMRRSYATDVFSHKLKVAGNSGTITRALEELAYSLGVQSIWLDSKVIAALRTHEREALRRMREETVYYTMLTVEANKARKGKEITK